MPRMVLPDGKSIRTFRRPPEGFSALDASDRELRIYGFPRRPTGNPRLLALWEEKLRAPVEVIQPEFQSRGKRVRCFRQTVTGATDTGWSGAVIDLQQPPDTSEALIVIATWTVPWIKLSPCNQSQGVTYEAASWIGIDGNGAGTVVQIGVESDLTINPGSGQPPAVTVDTYAWWEWYPGNMYKVSNATFPINSGDAVSAVVCVFWSTVNPVGWAAELSLLNETTRQLLPISIPADQATPGFLGESIEWVMEVPTLPAAAPVALADFGTLSFTNCYGSASGADLYPSTAQTLSIRDANEHTLTAAWIPSYDEVGVQFLGDGPYDGIFLTIGTGGDDLRQDSAAVANLLLNGQSILTVPLKEKNAPGWGNNSTNSTPVALLPATSFPFVPTCPVQFESLKLALQITLIQGGSWLESPDSWNISSVEVFLTSSTGLPLGLPAVVFSSLGFWRLTESAPSQTWQMS